MSSIASTMAKEKFILVSLKEDESKQLAQIISNKTSRKILDYLAEKEATESELAAKLAVPISTVHYNLQALLKAKMIESDEFHYSDKGKEVNHYKSDRQYRPQFIFYPICRFLSYYGTLAF
jgi:DNA-binding transcriptional ArsR family regulator